MRHKPSITLLGGIPITTSTTKTEAAAPATRTGAHTFALAAAELVANTRCRQVVLLDLRGRSPVTEFFVIATGTSPTQMRTAVEEVRDLGKKSGFAVWQTSGYESAKWILADCVSVVVHVFEGESRDFYDLEMLWGDCPRIDWRAELGLPPVHEEETIMEREENPIENLDDEIDAEEEDAELDGEDTEDEDGDADIDEDAEEDNPIVMELPDESTGTNSVEFVEIDPPSTRRKKGRALYPTPIGNDDERETGRSDRVVGFAGGVNNSLDEDDVERHAEAAADTDVEAVSKEDLSPKKIKRRIIGGVSTNINATGIGRDEESQSTSRQRKGNEEEITESQEIAAETTSFSKRTADVAGVDQDTQQPGQRNRKTTPKNRAAERGPKVAAPRAAVKLLATPSKKPGAPAKKIASTSSKTARKSLTNTKKSPKLSKQTKSSAKTVAKKPSAKTTPSTSKKSSQKPSRNAAMAKAPATKKPATKTVAKKAPAKKSAAKKAIATKAPAKKPVAKKAAPKKK